MHGTLAKLFLVMTSLSMFIARFYEIFSGFNNELLIEIYFDIVAKMDQRISVLCIIYNGMMICL
jgi:hypothetical protein